MRFFSRLHWIVGSAFALLFLMSALTGAVIAPNARHGPFTPVRLLVSPGSALDAATDAVDEGDPSMLMFPWAGNPNYVVTMKHRRVTTRVEVSPQNGRARVVQGRDLFNRIADLHQNLAIGFPGKVLLAVSGCSLFIMVGSGLVLWSMRLMRRRRYDAHTIAGLLAALPLLVVSVTGTSLELRGIVGNPRPAMQAHGGGGERPDTPNVNRAVAIAQQAVPGEHVTQIVFPARENMPLILRTLRGDVRDPRLETEVRLDAQTLAVQRIMTPNDRSLLERFLTFAYAVHTGVIGGFPTRALVFITALLLATLTVTGFAKAWPRIANALRRRRARPESSAVK